MSELSPPGGSERTPEQHEAVRRRSLPVALGGAICGAAGLAMLITGGMGVNAARPPGLLGVNLSFCAMMIGVGILFYARRTPGTRAAIALALVAVLTGIVGPLVFARQSMHWRVAMEERELGNVRAIETAARGYAAEHGGAYPADLAVLLESGRLKPEVVHSPFGSDEMVSQKKKLPPEKFAEWYRGHSDYLYFAGDLKLNVATSAPATGPATMPAGVAEKMIVACGTDPIMRKWISVVYADGRADFLNLEGAQKALADSNEAREKLGLPAIRPPESVRKAQELERRQ